MAEGDCEVPRGCPPKATVKSPVGARRRPRGCPPKATVKSPMGASDLQPMILRNNNSEEEEIEIPKS